MAIGIAHGDIPPPKGLGPGLFRVAFARPLGMRFSPPNAAADDVDSDPDPLSGWVAVVTNGADDLDRVDAGFYANAPPVAVDDSFTAHVNTPVFGNVLANDSDADGDTLTASVVAGPSHGMLTFNSNGSFTYMPNAGWTGADSFTYQAADGFEGTDTANVDLIVATSAPPVGVNDSYSTPAGPLFVDAAAGVLANDTKTTARSWRSSQTRRLTAPSR